MSHVSHMNESCLTYERVTSHTHLQRGGINVDIANDVCTMYPPADGASGYVLQYVLQCVLQCVWQCVWQCVAVCVAVRVAVCIAVCGVVCVAVRVAVRVATMLTPCNPLLMAHRGMCCSACCCAICSVCCSACCSVCCNDVYTTQLLADGASGYVLQCVLQCVV